MKRKISFILFVVVLVISGDQNLFGAALDSGDKPRNIILFIGDGMSVPQRMVAEEFSRAIGGEALAMNTLPNHAMTRTYSATSLVTDSAAAATAIACGQKTFNGALGVDKNSNPIASSMEIAREAGKKTGLVTSVTINHATPAGFYAHRTHRSMIYEIGLDLISSSFDLFLGGGLNKANEKTSSSEYRGNLYHLAQNAGYIVKEGRAGFDELVDVEPEKSKIWWRGCEEALPYAIDSKSSDIPRLPELTRFALDFLEKKSAADGDGFFLMVEGGRIDWAGHANEAATNLRDLLELDEAVKVALDFQSRNPDTLIIVTGDHETGGMSMGFAATGYAFYMERLASQTCSTEAFEKRFKELKKHEGVSFEDAAKLLEECYGFKFSGDEASDPMVLNSQDIESLKHHYAEGGLADKARRIMQTKAGVGWTSSSHTGLPALTTSIGPGSEKFTGLLDNTDIAKIIKSFFVP